MSQDIEEKIFAVSSPARLEVINVRGSTQVLPGEDGTITVRAIKHLDSGDSQLTRVCMEQAGDSSVKVETDHQVDKWQGLFSRPCKVDFVLQVPRRCNLKVTGVSNSSSIMELSGEFQISTVSGPLHLEDLSGPLIVSTVSGEVFGRRLSGTLRCEAVSGAVRLIDSSFSAVSGSTVSGEVVLESLSGAGPFSFNSTSGRVRLGVPTGYGWSLDFSTLNGRLRTTLPITKANQQGRRRLVDTDGGGPAIRFEGVSADLIIEATSGEWSNRGGEKVGDRQEDVLEILDRIERSEISVEEGLNWLHHQSGEALD